MFGVTIVEPYSAPRFTSVVGWVPTGVCARVAVNRAEVLNRVVVRIMCVACRLLIRGCDIYCLFMMEG